MKSDLSNLRWSRIFLIGYRGVGKTTVAQLLAGRLGWQWVDADVFLEEKYGRTIREIFSDEGEAGFRDKEAEVLAELCSRGQHVVATGGGVILREENRLLMARSGVLVWLTAQASTIWQRVNRDTTSAERRPNLTVGGLQEIEDILERRRPLYKESADLIVDADNRSPEDIAAQILEQMPAK